MNESRTVQAVDIFVGRRTDEIGRTLRGRKVDQSGLRTERERLPTVGAAFTRVAVEGRVRVVSLRIDLGASGNRIHATRPIDPCHVRCDRQELAGLALEHVEESVLGRVQQNPAWRAGDGQLGENHVLHGVIVPAIPGRLLKMPYVASRIGIQRDDGGDEQVVALAL